ncbi:hypothetical protein RHGRI_024035 [Rhododendron griersonianum]|uniref:AIPP2-like SPOC-like domain-containing protein n=1 Tax=Rhododendron griersonianum TaxID=479676 RepID=A0AAV6JA05_9ERIC|nr:hypothetical protein RHGRI_024035 [Rhododendron griersonianum]
MMLSSGAKDFASRAKRNLHSNVTPSKIVPSMPARTPIKLKVLSLKSSQSFKANPSFETVEPLPPRHCNTQINLGKLSYIGIAVQVLIEKKQQHCMPNNILFQLSRGSFKIIDSISREELNDGFKAHPPSTVRGKVYEFSKKMPKVLQFKMLPRDNVWTDIFEDYYPTEDDIGLYFFSSDSQRSVFFTYLEL